ncbi:hypothetical protein H4S06_002334 [Coemansia sp. BCRC 34490]|nr:hypothetical protein H4S06_002334 [Coemansia sp. BCRC 34490]
MTQEQKVSVEDVEEPTTNTSISPAADIDAVASAAAAAGGGPSGGMSIAAASAAAQGINPAVFQKQQSAAEKKARKALQKKGLEQVSGIVNISFIRKNSPMFSIYSPDVYKNATSDTWIVFGEARVDNYGKSFNPNSKRAASAAASAAAAAAASAAGAAGAGRSAGIEAGAAGASEAAGAKGGDEDVDESGLDAKDIELVMSQSGCSRPDAVKALNSNGKDVVNAIMELTIH